MGVRETIRVELGTIGSIRCTIHYASKPPAIFQLFYGERLTMRGKAGGLIRSVGGPTAKIIFF